MNQNMLVSIKNLIQIKMIISLINIIFVTRIIYLGKLCLNFTHNVNIILNIVFQSNGEIR